MNQNDYFELNKKMWNQRAEIHVDTEFYDMDGFRDGKTSLNKIELDLLGDLQGKDLLHLQCHFGQDTLSFARMGANVTGLDLSDKAIETAKNLSKDLNIPAEFICANVFDADKATDKKFDIVFTSYGAIGWLPELNTWAKNIHALLKPGGKFLIVEFHPVVWMFDDKFTNVEYGYFNSGVFLEEFEGTYADKENKTIQKSACWNHSISDIQTSLLEQGLKITGFKEYDYSPYNIFTDPVKTEHGWQINKLKNKLPMVFSLEAQKENYE